MTDVSIFDGTNTIKFDTLGKWTGGRKPSKTFEQGDLDGEGAVESSGASLHALKVTFEIKSNGINGAISALQVWKQIDNMVKNNNDVSHTLTIPITGVYGEEIITFTGKPNKGWTYDWDRGDPDGFVGTIGFTCESVGAIT